MYLKERLVVVLDDIRRHMSIARQGIWLCPECGNYEVWKTRDIDTNHIDRKCSKCNKRARFTLNRSTSGKGRKRNYEIWERDLSVGFNEIIQEASRRNNKEETIRIESEISEQKMQSESQDNLPHIWGLDWSPKKPLSFTRKVSREEVKKELLRFIAERHDGYLEIIAAEWDMMKLPIEFNGINYHQF